MIWDTTLAATPKVLGEHAAGIDAFCRVSSLIDLPLMVRSMVTIFGLGSGGQQVVPSLAACGVGTFHLVDGGRFNAANIGTTMIGGSDCGQLKVDVAARRIAEINPAAVIKTYAASDDALLPRQLEEIITASDVVLQLTDSPKAAFRLNRLGLELRRDVIHAGTHPGNATFEIIGTLAGSDTRSGCYRCLARERGDAFDAGALAGSPSFAAFRASAEMRNAVVTYLALGTLHYRAGAPKAIAAWGEAFARLPCWIGRLGPAVLGGGAELFGDVPTDLFFGVRAYRNPLPQGWICPACKTRGP